MSRDFCAFRVALILIVSLLLALPADSLPRARADLIQFTAWSAFGPRQNTISFKVYGDTQSMLADFDAGLIDITDVPDLVNRVNCSANPNCDTNNANYYVTNGQAELGEEQIDISHQVSFLGLALQCGRYTLPAVGNPAQCSPGYLPKPPTIIVNSDTTTACDTFHFQLVIHLKNFEENLAVIADPNEMITATPAAGVASTKQSATGAYDLGCISSLPPGYVVSTAVYGDAATPTSHVAQVNISTSGGIGPTCVRNRLCDVDLNVDYNSPSTKEPSLASIHIGRALQHLVDKPNFVNIPVLNGQAVCDDIWGSPSQGIMTNVGDSTAACSPRFGPAPVEVSHATIVAECAELASSPLPGFSPIFPCNPVSLYNLVSDNIHGAPSCALNNLGAQIPTATCFPSQGNQSGGGFTILPETGYSGSSDLTAACDHLVLAGFTIAPAGATCADVAAGNVVNDQTAHVSNNGQQISYLIRLPGAFPARPRYGVISGDELNFLFGTGAPNGGTVCYGVLSPSPGPGAVCSPVNSWPHFYGIGEVGSAIFQAQATWNLYTGAQSHASTPDSLLYTWHSQFAGSSQSGANCGGPPADFPNDFDMYCDPLVDTQAFAGEFSTSLAVSMAFFQNTATLGATRGVLAPIFSNTDRYLALEAWDNQIFGARSSLISSFGKGFAAGGAGAWQSLLNMRPNGLVTSGVFQAGGGIPGQVRRSSTGGGTLHQNPFTADSAWEADLINQIWDTMLVVNPNTGGSDLQLIDWMTRSHSSSFDPASGHNTQIWNLRNDICWQDSLVSPVGQPCDRPVTADDVCFSILMQRDGPGVGFTATQDVINCSTPDSQTVVVVHYGLSAFQDINIGGVRIIPVHLWGTACGWASGPHDSTHEPKSAYNAGVGVIGAPCIQSGFDPMALTFNGAPFSTPLPPNVSGLMVGSGAYMCVVPAHTGPGPAQGKIGGSCAVNPATGALQGQALDVGFVQVETKFPFYMRCCDNQQGSELQVVSWADATKIGKVTIVAASALSFAFGSNDGYFAHPLFGGQSVDIGDAAFMAFAFDSGTIAPCVSFSCPGPPNEPTPAAPLLFPDPLLDPYLANIPGGVKVYYLGMTASASSGTLNGTLELATLSGSPSPTSFTATIGPSTVTGAADPVHLGNILFSFTGLGSIHNRINISYQGSLILIENT